MLKHIFLFILLFLHNNMMYSSCDNSSICRPTTPYPISANKYRDAKEDFSPDSVKTQTTALSKHSKIVGGPFGSVVHDADLDFGFFIDLDADDEEVAQINDSACSSSRKSLNMHALSKMGQASTMSRFAETLPTTTQNIVTHDNLEAPNFDVLLQALEDDIENQMSQDMANKQNFLGRKPILNKQRLQKLVCQEVSTQLKKRSAVSDYNTSDSVISNSNCQNLTQAIVSPRPSIATRKKPKLDVQIDSNMIVSSESELEISEIDDYRSKRIRK